MSRGTSALLWAPASSARQRSFASVLIVGSRNITSSMTDSRSPSFDLLFANRCAEAIGRFSGFHSTELSLCVTLVRPFHTKLQMASSYNDVNLTKSSQPLSCFSFTSDPLTDIQWAV